MFEPSTGRGCDLLRRRFRRHIARVPRSRGKAAILSCGHQQSSHPASTSSQCHKNSRRGKCSQGRHSDDPPVRPGVHYRRTDRRAPFRGSIRGAASTIRSFMPPCPFGSHPHRPSSIGVHHSPRFLVSCPGESDVWMWMRRCNASGEQNREILEDRITECREYATGWLPKRCRQSSPRGSKPAILPNRRGAAPRIGSFKSHFRCDPFFRDPEIHGTLRISPTQGAARHPQRDFSRCSVSDARRGPHQVMHHVHCGTAQSQNHQCVL